MDESWMSSWKPVIATFVGCSMGMHVLAEQQTWRAAVTCCVASVRNEPGLLPPSQAAEAFAMTAYSVTPWQDAIGVVWAQTGIEALQLSKSCRK
jgi:hypothetical protein